MAPKVTSSRNRSTRKASKPPTTGQNPGRANRQSISQAKVTQSGKGTRGSANVTNAAQRPSTGSAKVTGTTQKALPPGRKGGAIVRQETKPENPRRTSARSRQATAARGSAGPNRVGQPSGAANRQFGANVVNRAVNRAVTAARMAKAAKIAGRVALPIAIGNQAAEVVRGFKTNLTRPISGRGPRKDTGRYIPGNQQVKITKPKPSKPAAKPIARKPSKSTLTPTRTASRSANARPTTSATRSTSSRSSTPAKPKVSSTSSGVRAASTSGIGPVSSGESYARMKGSISEQLRELRAMREASQKRQKGE